ncbi:hypothetical protein MYOV024v1_p0068 [Vibrio phage PS34B.2]|nr:hypothetical protein MYOV024v1_p0068 [Vibrio phage PS34B.2]
MSEAKFTKGKWEVKSTSIHPARIKVKDKKGMQGRIIGDVRSIDDASLIAAAPEMYEMLKILTESENMEDAEHLLRESRLEILELLAKARGEQND